MARLAQGKVPEHEQRLQDLLQRLSDPAAGEDLVRTLDEPLKRL